MDITEPKPDPRPSLRLILRFGLRDTAAWLLRPTFWWALAAVVCLTAMAGPFGTYALMSFLSRLAYWAVGIILVSVLATGLSFIALHATRALGWPWHLGAIGAALVAVPPQWGLVFGLENFFIPDTSTTMLALLPFVAIPVIVITILMNAIVIRKRVLDVAAAPDEAALRVPGFALPEPSLLFQRIPQELGRDLVCLRAQDHYLEAITTTGSALVLMRLGDAERDLAALRGMRVHRSWWVALDHVTDFATVEGGGVSLTTTTGHTIPVARAQRAALRAALERPARRAAE